jgi:hypothetical protein
MSQVHFDGLIAAGTENAVTEDLGKLILGAKLKYFFRQDYASRMYLRQTYPSKRGNLMGKVTQLVLALRIPRY